MENNVIYIPKDYDWVVNGLNDQIVYGKIDVMKKYNSINIVELLENNLSIPHPESLNFANIKLNNIIVERVNLIYKLDK